MSAAVGPLLPKPAWGCLLSGLSQTMVLEMLWLCNQVNAMCRLEPKQASLSVYVIRRDSRNHCNKSTSDSQMAKPWKKHSQFQRNSGFHILPSISGTAGDHIVSKRRGVYFPSYDITENTNTKTNGGDTNDHNLRVVPDQLGVCQANLALLELS